MSDKDEVQILIKMDKKAYECIKNLDNLEEKEGMFPAIEAFNAFVEAVQKGEVENINEERWIPVSERLPEKNLWVLVTVEQYDCCHLEIMRRHNFREAWTDGECFYTYEVTAWMPMPKLYMKESEEK